MIFNRLLIIHPDDATLSDSKIICSRGRQRKSRQIRLQNPCMVFIYLSALTITSRYIRQKRHVVPIHPVCLAAHTRSLMPVRRRIHNCSPYPPLKQSMTCPRTPLIRGVQRNGPCRSSLRPASRSKFSGTPKRWVSGACGCNPAPPTTRAEHGLTSAPTCPNGLFYLTGALV